MSKYNNLLMDEVEALVNIILRHKGNTSFSANDNKRITTALEAVVDNLGDVGCIIRDNLELENKK